MEQWGLRETPEHLAQRYRHEGFWTGQSLGDFLDELIRADRDREFRVWSEQRPYRGTVGDAYQLAAEVAGGLRRRGVEAGDVVAFQLPNCVEAAAAFWGICQLGAVVVPIVHFYGPKEVGYILAESQAKALITADEFGWLDYLANLDKVKGDLADLEHVIVIPMSDDAPNLGELSGSAPFGEELVVSPEAPALLAYTSGTTANPKGVIHSHQSIVAEIAQLGDIQPEQRLPLLVGAPVGHAIGMLSGLLLPLYLGDPVHLADQWNPPAILDAMIEAGVYAGSGATFFLLSLLDDPAFGPQHAEKMRFIGLGGSAVPVAVGERAAELGISVIRSYGSTEHPSTTGATHDEERQRRISTDGHPLSGVELRIVDDDGRELPPGEPGEILSRGPDLFIGYTDPGLTEESFADDGWFRTGDIGVLDDQGWLTITDRKKDVIIRGGETISPAEVEEVITRLPGVAEVAVVAVPDERLGEHGCAFVRVAPAAAEPTLDDLRGHLEAVGLAKQKWPEELVVVEDFPRTAAGKVKKYELRQGRGGDQP
ncbi:MAG: AMP-dependent synthetase [Actinobacteria bacterium]|nr:MAG: AMP-dependent synthetase [Actinomycetota bacterium]RIK04503.1 MAG: AMP-dependent synthetase [Acidobacteriota bacterium]